MQQTSRKNITLRQFKVVKDRRANPRILLTAHLHKSNTKSLIGRGIERNVNILIFHCKVLLSRCLDNDFFEFGYFFFLTFGQIVDHEIVGEVFVNFRRVCVAQRVSLFHCFELNLLLQVLSQVRLRR